MTTKFGLVMFADRPCTPCMGTGVGSSTTFGVSKRCPACKGKARLNHVQLPGGQWTPVAEWRETERGTCFYHVLGNIGVVLSWDELIGGSAYLRVEEAENGLDAIKQDLPPLLDAA